MCVCNQGTHADNLADAVDPHSLFTESTGELHNAKKSLMS